MKFIRSPTSVLGFPGGFPWKRSNPTFMKMMELGHFNWMEFLGLAEEGEASLSLFFSPFGADSKGCASVPRKKDKQDLLDMEKWEK